MARLLSQPLRPLLLLYRTLGNFRSGRLATSTSDSLSLRIGTHAHLLALPLQQHLATPRPAVPVSALYIPRARPKLPLSHRRRPLRRCLALSTTLLRRPLHLLELLVSLLLFQLALRSHKPRRPSTPPQRSCLRSHGGDTPPAARTCRLPRGTHPHPSAPGACLRAATSSPAARRRSGCDRPHLPVPGALRGPSTIVYSAEERTPLLPLRLA